MDAARARAAFLGGDTDREGERDAARFLGGDGEGEAALRGGDRDADLDGERARLLLLPLAGALLGGDGDGGEGGLTAAAVDFLGGERDGDLESEAAAAFFLPLPPSDSGDLPLDAFTFSLSVGLPDLSTLVLRRGTPEADELLLEELLELEPLDEDPDPLSLSLLDPLLELELEPELEQLPELLEELEESLSEELSLLELELSSLFCSAFSFSCSSICACICSANSFGAFFRCSLSPSVKPPRPIDVKKLIAKRVFLALSVGKRPENTSCM